MSPELRIENEEQVFQSRRPSQWKNRQRTLFVPSHRLTLREKLLLKNLISFTPHAKKESKDDKDSMRDQLYESCQSKSCSNVFSIEKQGDCAFVSIARFPTGPTFRFLATDIVAASDYKFHGNALRYSRPLLSFSAAFSALPQMKLLRHLLVDCFSAPLNHPKTQPFVDRVLSFFVEGADTVLLRHYQIFTSGKGQTELIEIGPRVALRLLSVVEGFFTGACLYRGEAAPVEARGTSLQKERWLHKKISKQRRAEARGEHHKRLATNEEQSSMDEFGPE